MIMPITLRSLRGSLALKALLALALVALGDRLFWQGEAWAGVQGLFGLGLVAALLIARPAVRGDHRGLCAALCAAFYALAQLWDPSLLAFVLFWIAIGLATLLPSTARFGDAWRWFQRLLGHGFKSLIGPLIDFFRLSLVKTRRPSSRLRLRHRLPMLVLPLLGSALILSLFSAANPLIEQWLSAITPPQLTAQSIARAFFWSAMLVLAWGVLRPRLPRWTFGTFEGSGDLAIPGVTSGSVLLSLIMFNALFLVQNTLDLAFLWGGARLPDGMTLAQYAHRGAYPLIVTALLAALFVLVALRPGSATARMPLARRLVWAWIGQNLILVANAALRTWNYVEAYSLTVLRISALLWMGLVAVGLVLVLYRLVHEKSSAWLINANCVVAALLLSAVSLVDLGAVSARWNLAHAREIDGTGAGLDLCYLDRLGESALVPLAEFERRGPPPGLAVSTRSIRWSIQNRVRHDVEQGGWSVLDERRLSRTRAILGPAGDTQPQPFEADCYALRD
jgi:hypothetical protein